MKNYNSDLAYDYIRTRIISGQYPPGQSLVTELLASEVGISRTPVRDALRKLEADGLVTIRPRLGANVKVMNAAEYNDICEVRLALESHAAGLAAKNRTASDLDEIQFALNAMGKIVERIAKEPDEHPHIQELIRHDIMFHVAIISAAKNELLKSEIMRLHIVNRVISETLVPEVLKSHRAEIDKASKDVRRKAVQDCHTEIYEAIARSEAIVAKRAMDYHLQEQIQATKRLVKEAKLAAREISKEEMAYSV